MASSPSPSPSSVLFLCLGNICRSPTAEAVFKATVEKKGASARYTIDSCGTGGGANGWYKPGGFSYHEGEAADRALRDSEKANTPMDEELAEELADTLIPTVVSPGGGYVGGDTPAPTAREAMAEQSEPKLSDKTSLQLESADATGFTASMSMM